MLRGAWVPFALSDEGALAAVLTQACRSVLEVLLLPRQPGTRRLVAAASSSSSGAHATTPAEAYYSRLMLLYKGLCIRSTNVSLSLEWPHVSDATIAKSVMMGTEEVGFFVSNCSRARSVSLRTLAKEMLLTYAPSRGSQETWTPGWSTPLPLRA